MPAKWNFFVLAFCLWLTYVVGQSKWSKTIKQLKEDNRKPERNHGEKWSNCSCPSDALVDEAQELCGYEIQNRTSNTNICEAQSIYRCMDPYPWVAIEKKDCTNLRGEKRKKLPVHHCLQLPNGYAPRARECVLPKSNA
jgi:hypothetical protein